MSAAVKISGGVVSVGLASAWSIVVPLSLLFMLSLVMLFLRWVVNDDARTRRARQLLLALPSQRAGKKKDDG